MQLINFSLFVESWRSRFLKGRQQWHSHYRGLLLGYRAGVTTIKLYHQVSQLQVGLHLIRAVFARGGQCWGYAVSVGNRYTEYGHLYQRWMPGQFSNNWFAVDQNRYRRQQFTTTAGGALTYLKSHLQVFNRRHQHLELVTVRARVIYRLFGHAVKFNLRVRRRYATTDQVGQHQTQFRAQLHTIKPRYLKKRHHSNGYRSLLNTNTQYSLQYQHAAARRQKLHQNQLVKLSRFNFLTTEINQRLISKYLLRWSLWCDQQRSEIELIEVRPNLINSCFLYVTQQWAVSGYNPVTIKLGRFTWFNQQCFNLRYVPSAFGWQRSQLKIFLIVRLDRLSKFYRQTSIAEQHSSQRGEFPRQFYNRRTFFRFGQWPKQISLDPPGMKPAIEVRRRRASKVRPFRPPLYLKKIFATYLAYLARQRAARRARQRAKYRAAQFYYKKKGQPVRLRPLLYPGRQRLVAPQLKFNYLFYQRQLFRRRILPKERYYVVVRPRRLIKKRYRLVRIQHRARRHRLYTDRYNQTALDRALTVGRLTGLATDQQMLLCLEQVSRVIFVSGWTLQALKQMINERRRTWNTIHQQALNHQLPTVTRQVRKQINQVKIYADRPRSLTNEYFLGYTSVNRRHWRPATNLFTARRGRQSINQTTHFRLSTGRQPTTYSVGCRQPLSVNYGQLQLQLFPAVVISGALTSKLQSLASEVANTKLPFVYLYASSVAPYVASYGVIWNNSLYSSRGLASLIDILYRYTQFSASLQMFIRRLEL